MFHNVVITGGQFTNVQSSHDAVSTTLLNYIVAEAIFDSAERYSAGKCHPGTREEMIEQITHWTQAIDNTQSILWVYGSAGCGKSSIMQSMCELLKSSHPGSYAGSFFFARGHVERGKGIKLFTTLSYQLALHFPPLRKEINATLYTGPTLPTKSIEAQLLSLIVHPLLRCREFLLHKPVLVIDGLDECDDDQGIDSQCQIIVLLAKSIVEHDIPVRVIIASRPEYWIRDEFEASPLVDITRSLSLRRNLDVDRDIRLYLTEEFEQIRQENLRIMGSVEQPWPSTNIIDHLVREASGQFIYASTVLRFVGKFGPFSNPREQLRIITTPGPHRAAAFTDLDRLYATILSAYPRRETIKRVLGGLLAHRSATVIEVVLGVDPEEINLVLEALSSLVDIHLPLHYEPLLAPIFGPPFRDQNVIKFCHLSFREFLEDEARSGAYYVDVSVIQAELMGAFFSILEHNIDQSYEIEPQDYLNISLTSYHGMMEELAQLSTDALFSYQRKVYYNNCERHRDSDIKSLLHSITRVQAKLQLLDPGRNVKHPECLMRDMECVMASVMLPSTTLESMEPKLPARTMLHRLGNAVRDLRDTALLAKKKAILQLSLCDGLDITPTLIYIDRCNSEGYSTTMTDLLGIPGNSTEEILLTLRQHRHILKHVYSFGYSRFSANLNDLHKEVGGDEVWFSRTECANQWVALVCQYLQSTTLGARDMCK